MKFVSVGSLFREKSVNILKNLCFTKFGDSGAERARKYRKLSNLGNENVRKKTKNEKKIRRSETTWKLNDFTCFGLLEIDGKTLIENS